MLKWFFVALSALAGLWPSLAFADPILFAATVAPHIGVAATDFLIAYGADIALAATIVYGASQQRRKARAIAARQKSQFIDSLQDRSATLISSEPPWRIIYGECITGGVIVAQFVSDNNDGYRPDGSRYVKHDGLQHIVVVLASHEVEAIDEIYIDGVAVGPLDADGKPTTGDFARTVDLIRQVTLSPLESFGEEVRVNSVTLIEKIAGPNVYVGDKVTLTDDNYTINNISASQTLRITYSVTVSVPNLIIRKHLGEPGQAVDAYLNSLFPEKWSSSHVLTGIAYVVMTFNLDYTQFQGGPPNPTFRIRGKKVYDTRTSTTAYSNNPALCIRDYLLEEYGYQLQSSDVETAATNAAANACDDLIDLTVGEETQTNVPRYTLNGVISTDDSKESVLEDMCLSMAGYAVPGAQWRIIAGAWSAPVMALTDDDLDGQIEIVQAGIGLDDVFNGVRGVFISSDNASPSDFDSYQNSTLVNADGYEWWSNFDLKFTDNKARAKNLCRIFVEKNRQSMLIRYPAKLSAWPLQIGDRVTVTSAEYGFSAKEFRVTDWSFIFNGQVMLTLQEDGESVYDLADAATADELPNTSLPSLTLVAGITGLAAQSGTDQLLATGNGAILPRVLVTWDAVTSPYVDVVGGSIRVSWSVGDLQNWREMILDGGATSAYITGVSEDDHLLINVYAVNAVGMRGPNSYLAHVVVGKTELPPDITGFLINGDLLTWDEILRADVPDLLGYELRFQYGQVEDWGTAMQIHSGYLTDARYDWRVRPSGTVTIMARAVDTTGNKSALSAVIVTDLGDQQVENLLWSYDFKAAGFPGTLEGCTLSGGNLVADSADLFFGDDPLAAMFYPPSDLMFGAAEYATLIYTSDNVVVSAALAGSAMYIEHEFLTAGGASIEYKLIGQGLMFSPPGDLMFSPPSELFFGEDSDWFAWPGQVLAKNATYKFRVTLGYGSVQSTVSGLSLVIDAPDQTETINDLAVANTGTAIPYTKSYSSINTQVTLQQNGSGAITVEIDKTDPLNPIIYAYNSSHVAVSGALVDVSIRGIPS